MKSRQFLFIYFIPYAADANQPWSLPTPISTSLPLDGNIGLLRSRDGWSFAQHCITQLSEKSSSLLTSHGTWKLLSSCIQGAVCQKAFGHTADPSAVKYAEVRACWKELGLSAEARRLSALCPKSPCLTPSRCLTPWLGPVGAIRKYTTSATVWEPSPGTRVLWQDTTQHHVIHLVLSRRVHPCC